MADLKTNYKDDVLDTSANERRKYQMISNSDGTVSFVDVTTYLQNGDTYGSSDVNATNAAVNEVNNSLSNLINSATVSGTTSSNGNLTLDKTLDDIIPLFATAGIQTICTIFIGASDRFIINVKDTNGNNKTYTSVTMTYYYIEK